MKKVCLPNQNIRANSFYSFSFPILLLKAANFRLKYCYEYSYIMILFTIKFMSLVLHALNTYNMDHSLNCISIEQWL